MMHRPTSHWHLAKGAGMANKTRFWRKTICGIVALFIIGNSPVLAKHTGKKAGSDAAMALHHMHTILDQGLIMVMQGANLRMLSCMDMTPCIDQTTWAHAGKMIAEGKNMIKEMLSGSHMREMHEQGGWSDPHMAYTHELGAAVLAVVDDADQMAPGDTALPDRSKMCQIRIALNHALEMAAEGANLVMLGKMTMAGGIDEYSITHGRKMITEARTLWDETIDGQAMKALYAARTTPEASVQMSRIHRMVKDGDKVLVLLVKMDTMK